jgi:hypothetical protein
MAGRIHLSNLREQPCCYLIISFTRAFLSSVFSSTDQDYSFSTGTDDVPQDSSKKANIAPIIGGVVGGVLVVLLGVIFFLLYRRRKAREPKLGESEAELHGYPKVEPFVGERTQSGRKSSLT